MDEWEAFDRCVRNGDLSEDDNPLEQLAPQFCYWDHKRDRVQHHTLTYRGDCRLFLVRDPMIGYCETEIPVRDFDTFPHLHNWPCKCGAYVYRLR